MFRPVLRLAAVAFAGASCEAPPAPIGCDQGPVGLDARVDSEGPSLREATEAHVGIPPQGGAPYTAFGIVVDGALGDDTLLEVTGDVRDADGTVLGTVEQNTSVLCANAGPWSGRWYGGEAHIRYWGLALSTLDSKPVEVQLSVGRGGVAIASVEGALTLVSNGGGDTFLVGEVRE
ncbi:MAG: hypothetical protein RLZZ383_2590 [Pseudomonadota bacterium]|jgi:hypothetical protein